MGVSGRKGCKYEVALQVKPGALIDVIHEIPLVIHEV